MKVITVDLEHVVERLTKAHEKAEHVGLLVVVVEEVTCYYYVKRRNSISFEILISSRKISSLSSKR